MKKLFLSIAVLFTFNINLNADLNSELGLSSAPYPINCPRWEHGQVVHYKGVQQNVAGTTPEAFCWDIVRIEDTGIRFINSWQYKWEKYENIIRDESSYFWFANRIKYIYGEDYIGLYVKVVVIGMPSTTPFVRLNAIHGVLMGREAVLSPSRNILNGFEYTYFIPRRPLNTWNGTLNELQMAGELTVHTFGELRDKVKIYPLFEE